MPVRDRLARDSPLPDVQAGRVTTIALIGSVPEIDDRAIRGESCGHTGGGCQDPSQTPHGGSMPEGGGRRGGKGESYEGIAPAQIRAGDG